MNGPYGFEWPAAAPATSADTRPFLLFRVTNTAKTGNWVVARDADEAAAHFVACRRAKRIENTKTVDVTAQALANPTQGPDLPRFLASRTEPCVASLTVPQVNLKAVLTGLAQGIQSGPQVGTWEAF